jgi:hypothetical protein
MKYVYPAVLYTDDGAISVKVPDDLPGCFTFGRDRAEVPSWLNYKAEKANAPFSQILQQGLKEYLHVSE